MQKSSIRFETNHFTFKKKELKKKISDCLHICQCGRQFLSFPAVYSHAKIKHNFKISSRVGDQGRRIVQKESQMKIYYQILNSQILDQKSFSQSSENNQINQVKVKQNSSKFNFINKIRKLQTSGNKKNIYAVMIQFLNQSSKNYSLQGMNFTAQVMDLLTTSINEHYMHYDSSRVCRDYCSENTPETIPLYFNFFLIWYLPSKQKGISQNSGKIEVLLKLFLQWLKLHSYTHLADQKLDIQSDQNCCINFLLKTKQASPNQKQLTPTKKQVRNQSQQSS